MSAGNHHQQQRGGVHWHDEVRTVVERAVRRQIHSRAEADDVVQDVMLELWLKAGRVDWTQQGVLGLAATVARRRSIDHIRASRSRSAREERVGRGELRVHELVSEDVIVRLDRELVVDALDVLPEPQREAIVLAYFGGHSYADVARLLGLPEGTVKRRIRDGLSRLRRALRNLRLTDMPTPLGPQEPSINPT